tara:strand:- start:2494 stop:2742 length:249 start_codon:yes stop_codon:yes gene_type:complete
MSDMKNLQADILMQALQSGDWFYPSKSDHKHKSSVYAASEALLNKGWLSRDWDNSVLRYKTSRIAKSKSKQPDFWDDFGGLI